MLYFIPWVMLLLAVILAVPVTSFLEKRKYAPAKPRPDEITDESGYEDEHEVAEASDEVVMDEEQVEEVAFETPGGDDFSAFDEDFK
ncbi:hypothetical protein Poly51_38110 [Rubripirellula tenax]|uniref:Uncharacterized protein n=1 Tax=Rubripirellula tenax TaxID=2528015 RepID=A0A5C6ET49_9BACT|nr:hypothetical protein [Rubripirellula tenax]TWU50521.1 hypothetical protein Poly51_38110 [Rubripirellula tenax]